MVGSLCFIIIENTSELEEYKTLLKSILTLAQHEVTVIDNGGCSKWNIDQLSHIIIPETNELLKHMEAGKLFLKYGNARSQRQLYSTYLITDSLEALSSTPLGVQIEQLQTKIDNQR